MSQVLDTKRQRRMNRAGWKPTGWHCTSGETLSYCLSVGGGHVIGATINRDKTTGGWWWRINKEVADHEPQHPTARDAAIAAEKALLRLLDEARAELSGNTPSPDAAPSPSSQGQED